MNEMTKSIESAAGVLWETERGRDVGSDLATFLQGRISGLDGRGWRAVKLLIELYDKCYPGSVLEALEKFEVSHGKN